MKWVGRSLVLLVHTMMSTLLLASATLDGVSPLMTVVERMKCDRKQMMIETVNPIFLTVL